MDFYNQMFWSDEKTFNLNRTDGSKSYWNELIIDPRVFSKRHYGGGSVTMLACFYVKGFSNICFLNGTQNGSQYCDTLQKVLLPFFNELHANGYKFMQEGAPWTTYSVA